MVWRRLNLLSMPCALLAHLFLFIAVVTAMILITISVLADVNHQNDMSPQYHWASQVFNVFSLYVSVDFQSDEWLPNVEGDLLS